MNARKARSWCAYIVGNSTVRASSAVLLAGGRLRELRTGPATCVGKTKVAVSRKTSRVARRRLDERLLREQVAFGLRLRAGILRALTSDGSFRGYALSM